jgi:hypothetical protein
MQIGATIISNSQQENAPHSCHVEVVLECTQEFNGVRYGALAVESGEAGPKEGPLGV